MSERPQPHRWRCLKTGCNPELGERTAALHSEATGHRVAKWPVRSKAGQKKAKQRNRSGYYNRYNVGAKSAESRGFSNGGGGSVERVRFTEEGWDGSGEMLGQS